MSESNNDIDFDEVSEDKKPFRWPTKEQIEESVRRRKEEDRLMKHTMFFTGHRPKDLGQCYHKSESMFQYIKEGLRSAVIGAINEHNIERVMLGGALGLDTIAFHLCHELKQTHFPDLQLVLCVPFEEQPLSWVDQQVKDLWLLPEIREQYSLQEYLGEIVSKGPDLWFAPTITQYYEMVQLADRVVFVDTIGTYSEGRVTAGKYSVEKLQLRNEYMVDQSSVGVALFNRKKGGTANCVGYALKHYKNLYVVNPATFEVDTRYGF